jgi:hypothetical protein
MRNFITGIFRLVLGVTILVTLLVGFLWLFEFKPNNLYLVWAICYKSLAVSLLFFILFGGEK